MPFADMGILQLADRYGIDPEEIQFQWSPRSVNRMLAFIEAMAMSQQKVI